MSEAKFQACPFCGSEPTITDTGTHNGIRWLVKCDNALCGVNPYARSMNHDRALAIWNQRAGDREPDADKTAEAKHVGSSEIVLLLREQLNDLFLASSLLRTRIHTHGKTVMNFEDYKRHTASMLKTEKVLHQMQQNVVREPSRTHDTQQPET